MHAQTHAHTRAHTHTHMHGCTTQTEEAKNAKQRHDAVVVVRLL